MQTKNIDLDGALNRLGGDEELLHELMGFFLEDAPVLLDQVRGGLRDGNSVLVERGAHSLKGLSANFGADQAVAAAKVVEQMGRDGDLAAAVRAFPDLEQQVRALELALAAHRASAAQQ
jgi:HPt (histidine-containing phosphotransfer) domain-containing protein